MYIQVTHHKLYYARPPLEEHAGGLYDSEDETEEEESGEDDDEAGSFTDIDVSETRGSSKKRDDDLVGV